MNKCRDAIEGVEKKMRVQAHLKRRQAGFGQASLGCQCATFAFLRAARPNYGLARADNQGVKKQVQRNVSQSYVRHRAAPRAMAAAGFVRCVATSRVRKTKK